MQLEFKPTYTLVLSTEELRVVIRALNEVTLGSDISGQAVELSDKINTQRRALAQGWAKTLEERAPK